MSVTTPLDTAELRAAVAAVPDPELPPVTIGMLGMIHALTVEEAGRVIVELLPTWSGCPATDVIAEDVAAAVGGIAGVDEVVVRFRFEPTWTPARISEEGHDALRAFGVAPPTGRDLAAPPTGRDLAAPPTGRDLVAPPTGRDTGVGRSLPLLPRGEVTRPCPYCGSSDTSRESRFGPTPCRDLRFCHACVQPFEAFKG